MPPPDPFDLAAEIGRILDPLGVRYVIGGSVAAFLYGEPRSTVDLDIMIEADEAMVREVVKHLDSNFYVEEEDAVEAVRHGTSFNAIHFATLLKVDFFIAEKREAVRIQLERRRERMIGETRLWFYAAEDILIRKLTWYRMSGEQSDRQWRDIIGILRVSRETLDNTYLGRAAAAFEVTDLLARARADAASL